MDPMSVGEFINNLRILVNDPSDPFDSRDRHPGTKAHIYSLALAYEEADRGRRMLVSDELRADLANAGIKAA